ncbi:MAG: hypothetical protein U1F43_09955 [Myxococcota bacterium]
MHRLVLAAEERADEVVGADRQAVPRVVAEAGAVLGQRRELGRQHAAEAVVARHDLRAGAQRAAQDVFDGALRREVEHLGVVGADVLGEGLGAGQQAHVARAELDLAPGQEHARRSAAHDAQAEPDGARARGDARAIAPQDEARAAQREAVHETGADRRAVGRHLHVAAVAAMGAIDVGVPQAVDDGVAPHLEAREVHAARLRHERAAAPGAGGRPPWSWGRARARSAGSATLPGAGSATSSGGPPGIDRRARRLP